jgi:DHA1 family tetracycline resistance protein-like MFS transporter
MPLIFTVVFLGFFAGALVAPIYSPLFLHPVHGGGLLAATASTATKAFFLGTVLSAGRLGEFVGSPILGHLSDRFGRRSLLALAMTVTAAGNLINAYAVLQKNVWILIGGQFFIGFAGVLLVLTQSEIAHRSTGPEKTKRFGLVYMASSLAYVFAPAIGGHLGDISKYPWASYALPFYAAAAISVLCTALVWWRFPNSAPNEETLSNSLTLNPLKGIAYDIPWSTLRRLLIVNFVLYIGIDFVFQFNPVYFVQTWHFTSSRVGWFLSYTSIAMVLTQWLLVKPVGKRWTPRTVTAISAAALGLLLIALIIPGQWSWLYLILPFVGAAMALATTNMSALISETAPPHAQGRLLGVAHSVRVLGSAILCFGGGILTGLNAKLPILVGAAASLLAALLLRQTHSHQSPRMNPDEPG